MTLKVKYEPSKEPEKFRSNKGVANQFSIPGSTFTTWKKNKSLKLFKIHHWNNNSEKWNKQKVKWRLAEVVYIDAW